MIFVMLFWRCKFHNKKYKSNIKNDSILNSYATFKPVLSEISTIYIYNIIWYNITPSNILASLFLNKHMKQDIKNKETTYVFYNT